MERFVSPPISMNMLTYAKDEEFERDSNNQDIEILMMDQPRMQSPLRFIPSQDSNFTPI